MPDPGLSAGIGRDSIGTGKTLPGGDGLIKSVNAGGIMGADGILDEPEGIYEAGGTDGNLDGIVGSEGEAGNGGKLGKEGKLDDGGEIGNVGNEGDSPDGIDVDGNEGS